SASCKRRRPAATSMYSPSADDAFYAFISRVTWKLGSRQLRMPCGAHWRNRSDAMQIGIIGLGRMGGNIARRLMQHGHEAVVFDRNGEAVAALSQAGALAA